MPNSDTKPTYLLNDPRFISKKNPVTLVSIPAYGLHLVYYQCEIQNNSKYNDEFFWKKKLHLTKS